LRNFVWRPDKGGDLVAALKTDLQQMPTNGAGGAENK
jgi:hypothetical protein